jgi:hypothetical protein
MAMSKGEQVVVKQCQPSGGSRSVIARRRLDSTCRRRLKRRSRMGQGPPRRQRRVIVGRQLPGCRGTRCRLRSPARTDRVRRGWQHQDGPVPAGTLSGSRALAGVCPVVLSGVLATTTGAGGEGRWRRALPRQRAGRRQLRIGRDAEAIAELTGVDQVRGAGANPRPVVVHGLDRGVRELVAPDQGASEAAVAGAGWCNASAATIERSFARNGAVPAGPITAVGPETSTVHSRIIADERPNTRSRHAGRCSTRKLRSPANSSSMST